MAAKWARAIERTHCPLSAIKVRSYFTEHSSAAPYNKLEIVVTAPCVQQVLRPATKERQNSSLVPPAISHAKRDINHSLTGEKGWNVGSQAAHPFHYFKKALTMSYGGGLREGYVPPSLPPKPSHADRLSKSPSRRRDVPPAVPSPPSYSSKNSPPRPQSRRSAPSPAQSTPPRSSVERANQWFFTVDEVASTPSIMEGLSLQEERLRRAKGVNFIYQAGILLDLPMITLWVAGVFFHRLYMRLSMVEEKGGIHHYASILSRKWTRL